MRNIGAAVVAVVLTILAGIGMGILAGIILSGLS
jgi:hypothetical protein